MEIEGLQREVRDHEPRLALDGGVDGLNFFRHIALFAPTLMRVEGWVAAEVGMSQSVSVAKLFREAGMESISIMNDLADIGRVVAGRRGDNYHD